MSQKKENQIWDWIESILYFISVFVIGFCVHIWWVEIHTGNQKIEIVRNSPRSSGGIQSVASAVNPPESYFTTEKFRVTAYCPCSLCCGKFADNVTSCGYIIRPGDKFIAAPPEYDFNTIMFVPGYADKPVKVRDRGGAIKGKKLDVYFGTHQEALNWGVKYLEVKIYIGGDV